MVVDPRSHVADTAPPTVLLEEVLLDGAPDPEFHMAGACRCQAGQNRPGKRRRTSGMLRISPGKHRIEFRYTGVRSLTLA